MKHKFTLVVVLFAMLFGCSDKPAVDDDDDPDEKRTYISFHEEFNDATSEYLRHTTGGIGADFTWKMGVESPTEPGTKILSFKIDPEDAAGAGIGPEVVSKNLTFHGSYAARLKVPDVRDIQPNVGVVVGYFTYQVDPIHGQSEIDFEWLIADPEIIYIGTWTGSRDNSKRIGRIINMAEGIIYETSYSERNGTNWKRLTGEQNQPESIDPIDGYDASSQFYTYGFDWYPERIRWWMLHPVTSDTIVLWDYKGSRVGIPTTHTRYRMNFWHTNNWPVQTNPKSIEKPIFPFELEVDWMSYESL